MRTNFLSRTCFAVESNEPASENPGIPPTQIVMNNSSDSSAAQKNAPSPRPSLPTGERQKKYRRRLVCLCIAMLAMGLGVLAVAAHGHGRGHKILTKLPPPPAGVTDLKFNEFFVMPVGALGLEPTQKLRSLDGQRVRMLGYMVRQEKPPVGTFLFAAIPVQIHEHDNGLADGLPPATVRVAVPTCRDKPVPFAPDLMALMGTLQLGNRAETDGRVTFVRLELDPPKPSFFRRVFSARSDQGAEKELVRNTTQGATP